MRMTIYEKIEEDLKHCSLNGVKYSDYVKEHYISKAEYEARLKADMVAMLEEIDLEFEELTMNTCEFDVSLGYRNIIEQKINELRGEKHEV